MSTTGDSDKSNDDELAKVAPVNPAASSVEVWYKLGDRQADFVDIVAGGIVARLKLAIKVKMGDYLLAAAPDLLVYPPGTSPDEVGSTEPLDPGDSVPIGTTSKMPFLVVAPPERLQQSDGE